jgi:hypothetical protein
MSRKLTVCLILTSYIVIALLIGIQGYGSELTTPCQSVTTRYDAVYTKVFGYPFPAINRDDMAGDCDGEDKFGSYIIDSRGFILDTLIWIGLGAGLYVGTIAFFSKRRITGNS